MSDNKFTDWFKKLGKAWSERDPHQAVNLFSKDVEYYESVFDSSCDSLDKVLELWKVIPTNQKDVTFDFDIIATKNNLAVANWRVTRTLLPMNKKQIIDGIFVIKLNDEGRCNYLKQWRTVKYAFSTLSVS
ncbi:nuclear transport factor 2 family protein [Candidatus Woesearchaeota archaeon]|nr:nuclear transport factor 2 family protein [Candidatus Woesearchaeota archaeon]